MQQMLVDSSSFHFQYGHCTGLNRLLRPKTYFHHTYITLTKMSNIISLDFKSSALLIALVLVPIVILFCAVAVALSCSEHCSCRVRLPPWLTCRNQYRRKKRIHSDLESGTGRGTDTSEVPLQYERPVRSREHV